MKTNLLSIAVLLVIISTTSCTSYKSLSKSEYATSLKKGSITKITFSDSSRIKRFKIDQILTDTLKGSFVNAASDRSRIRTDRAIPTTKIKALKKRKFSVGKTSALIGCIVFISIPMVSLISLNTE